VFEKRIVVVLRTKIPSIMGMNETGEQVEKALNVVFTEPSKVIAQTSWCGVKEEEEEEDENELREESSR